MSTLAAAQRPQAVDAAPPVRAGVPSSATACLNLDDFEKAAEGLLKPKAWGMLRPVCPCRRSLLQGRRAKRASERASGRERDPKANLSLGGTAYYRSAADDERSKLTPVKDLDSQCMPRAQVH